MLSSSSVPASSAARISSGVSRMVPFSSLIWASASASSTELTPAVLTAVSAAPSMAVFSTRGLRGSSAASSSVSCWKTGNVFSCSSPVPLPAMGSAGAGSCAGSLGAASEDAASLTLGAADPAFSSTEAAVLSALDSAGCSVAASLSALTVGFFCSCFFWFLWVLVWVESSSHWMVEGSTVRPTGWAASRAVVPTPPTATASAMTMAATAWPAPRRAPFFAEFEVFCFMSPACLQPDRACIARLFSQGRPAAPGAFR